MTAPPAPEAGFGTNHLRRPLSRLAGLFSDEAAFLTLLAREDVVVYEVHASERPEVPGELSYGLSIVHPGRVGAEYFMTKGHFHRIRNTAEVYYCLQGRGLLLMETEDGEWAVEEFRPGRVVYVSRGWAHRSVNISEQEDLVTFFVCPSEAGHDYAPVESKGFRKLILHDPGGYRIVDNPRRH